MEYFSILMIIFSICIFLYGIHIFKSKKPYLPYTYHGKVTKSYYEYLGKVTMLVSLAPLFGAISAIMTNSVLICMSVFVGTFIVIMFLCVKYFHE